MTEVIDRFEEKLKYIDERIGKCCVTNKDALDIFELCVNLLEHHKQLRKSRENWKDKCFKYKEEIKELKERLM